jgi:hypothetical protein
MPNSKRIIGGRMYIIIGTIAEILAYALVKAFIEAYKEIKMEDSV